MSKIGKKPIEISEGVTIEIGENNKIKVKGSKGELESVFSAEMKIESKDKEVLVKPISDSNELYALWGLTRALLANMIETQIRMSNSPISFISCKLFFRCRIFFTIF